MFINPSDIRADKALKTLLNNTPNQAGDIIGIVDVADNKISIYAYGEKFTSTSEEAFITIENNGIISSTIKSMETASSEVLLSVRTKTYDGLVNEEAEWYILQQIEDRLLKNQIQHPYFFEIDFANPVFNSSNITAGYHTKGFNIKWNIIVNN